MSTVKERQVASKNVRRGPGWLGATEAMFEWGRKAAGLKQPGSRFAVHKAHLSHS